MSFHFLDGNTYGAHTEAGPGTGQVDAAAVVHATAADTPALTLTLGSWNVNIDGTLTADDGHGINLKDSGAYESQISISSVGSITALGGSHNGINAAHVTHVVNSGSIKAGHTGINAFADGDFTILNFFTGETDGGRYGIHVSGLGEHIIMNGGTIAGGEYSVLADSGAENLTNLGTLKGNVHLGDGNDIFQNFLIDLGDGRKTDGKVIGTVDLGKGDDSFFGGDNAEVVRDGDGKDIIKFGGGNDVWFGFLAGGDDGTDTVAGDGGSDTYDASQAGVQGVAINLDTKVHGGHTALLADDFNALTAADSITGFENAIGTNFADLLYGSTAGNMLAGLAGDDTLFGFDGNDVLKGDAGRDTLAGGRGKDKLYGGADHDVFDFNSIKESAKGSQRDTIYDFKRGTDDIDLRDIDAKNGVSGNQKFKFIGKQDFHGTKGELHFKDLGAKCLVSGDVNGDGKADFEIMVKAATLSAGDFLL